MTLQRNIESRLRRTVGQSDEVRAAVREVNEKEQWWVRCWNCRETTQAVRSELKLCSHCDKNIWSRDE